MNIEDFSKTMLILGGAYGKDITQEQIEIWYHFLKDVNPEQLKGAIESIIKKSEYFPSIAKIREEIANIELGEFAIIDPSEQWQKVLYCVRHIGPYREDKIKDYLGNDLYEITKRFGWEDLFNMETENTSYMGDRFIKFYKANQNNVKAELQLGTTFNNLIKRIDCESE